MGSNDATRPLHAALAALTGHPTQHARLLTLRTPLGPDVLLAERFEGVEAIGPSPEPGAPRAGYRFVVEALGTDTHLELKRLIGQPALVELLMPHGMSGPRPFHGHVTEAALLGSDGGLARFRLVIEPWLALLAERQDAWVFQGRTVRQIVEEVFADYMGAARLLPAWRWDLADEAAYPERSLCIQYHESDLAFVQRLLREEGLFCWFEHAAAPGEPALGRHTLVIADHNGAFAVNPQPRVRYTRADGQLAEDSLHRWTESARLAPRSVLLASTDYRSLDARPVQAEVDAAAAPLALTVADMPGAYAYEDRAQGQRLVQRQAEALAAQASQAQGSGPCRSAAPGSCFTLADHPGHDGRDDTRDRHVVLAVQHRARNNLHADTKAGFTGLTQTLRREARGAQAPGALPDGAEEPLYSARLLCQRAALPVRMAAAQQGHCAFGEADDFYRPAGEPARGEPWHETPGGSHTHGLGRGAAGGHGFGDADDHGPDGLGLGGFADTRWEPAPPDIRLHPRPTVHGVQTALVVGLQAPVHTDRDHRIKVQFHWQRGASGSHRLDHPGGDNAPANDASGTWVRVAESVAGANWGSHFTPRLGQEVLVGFIEGDIDRPVVLGSVYNGVGQDDAQGNRVATGAAGASGNAPAWFPGSERAGEHRGHQHAAVLAGYKSQELAASRSGTGGHNRLVFDDSPGQGRIELGTTSAQTWLQLGHLLQQDDNRLLAARGHGLDLHSQAWGSLRAGSGLLVSAHGRPGSLSGSAQMDVREPLAVLQQAGEMGHALAESAQRQEAKLPGEVHTVGAGADDHARQLPFERGLRATQHSLQGRDSRGEAPGSTGDGSGNGNSDSAGGAGTVPAPTRPDLVLAAPAGIAAVTPVHALMSAGDTVTVVGQEVQQLAQRDHCTVVAGGLVLFTEGQTPQPDRPVRTTGIQCHAASGPFSSRSLGGATTLTAQMAVEVASTRRMVKVTALKHILLTAAGAAIHLDGRNITLSGPGTVEFRAGMKELRGPAGTSMPGLDFAETALRLSKGPLQVSLVDADGGSPSGEAVCLDDGRGERHGLTISAGPSTLEVFKPGLSVFAQPARHS